MIISHGRRYIFVHIPKTGGTSLALALEARAMKDDILIGDTPKAKRRRGRLKDVKTTGRRWKHSTLQDVSGLITQAQMQEYFVFTLVRNPWDRLVSYYHWLRAQSFEHPSVGLAKTLDFSGFLNHPQTQASVLNNPYGSYVLDVPGQDVCNLFIRLENFRQDILPLESHLGFSLGALSVQNASDRRKDFRSYYTDADIDLTRDLCSKDINRFGYGFD